MWHSGNTRLAKVQTRLLRRYLGDTSTSSSFEEDGPHWYTTKTHVLPFQDHTGSTAYMVFNNRETSILPPLVSFSFYFTHPDACRNQEDLVALHDSIEPVMDSFHARFDMYFLPGATEDDCVAHYYGEKATRLDSKSMRREFERVKRPYTPPSTSRLPGMNKEYREDGGHYNGAMCVCTEQDWRQSQQLRCIQYGSDEPSLSRQIIGSWRPVSENSPGANVFDDETADMWIWNLIIDQRSEYTAAHQKATKKGWTAW
ncbi:hypothetical protein BJX66DRAFT_339756 [Aspergillus keveii]|uniref:Uncharacterized protein n=1 Tax=Aspergillus keveii TaxID=714993 RepID=A0ABR4G0A1_9EURO